MPKYSVIYDFKMSFEAVIDAASKKEARQKVKEVIGEPITIEEVREITNAS